jgi:hypothetical protein
MPAPGWGCKKVDIAADPMGGALRSAYSGSDVQTATLFPTEPELTPEIPPTWCEGSEVFHITEKCSRLKAIQRNKRVSGKPGVAMRQCFNCEDIIRAKRLG